MKFSVKVPQHYLDLVNQVFEIEKKASQLQEGNSIGRNITKLRNLMESELFQDGHGTIGLSYHNPIGEAYSHSRSDCEASISGTGSENLEIVEVIKPIVFFSFNEDGLVRKIIVQKAVVVAQAKS
jgi:hypothetical protein